MATSVLITGASGLVGTRLTDMLLQKGYQVSHLGRKPKSGKISSFVWDIDKYEIDPQALVGVDAIIHLAGTGVAEKRWSEERKKDILESRTRSTALLLDSLKNSPHSVKTFVSASAIGIYGYGIDTPAVDEESDHGTDFLARVVVQWEKAVDMISKLNIRVAKIRIGIVLSEEGGALVEMARPVRWGVGSPLGSGRQMMSWIHVEDVCSIFVKALEDPSIQGAYNAVAPNAVTNKEMTKAIARTLHRPVFLPPVPSFLLRIIVGEMAAIVINGADVSAEKIQRTGFQFKFPELEDALADLYK